MTDSNRAEAQAELRQVISDAFSAQTLWTTDWQAVQLQRCCTVRPPLPTHSFSFPCPSLILKPPPTIANLKRKRCKFQHSSCVPKPRPAIHLTSFISVESTSPTKKSKKTPIGKHSTGKEGWDLQDQTTLNRRAERFQREHQIERQRWVGNAQSSFSHSSVNTHQDVFSSTPPSGNWDEPENDIVTFLNPSQTRHSLIISDHATQDCRNLPGAIQRLSSPHIRKFRFPSVAVVRAPNPCHRNLIRRKFGHTLCYAKRLII